MNWAYKQPKTLQTNIFWAPMIPGYAQIFYKLFYPCIELIVDLHHSLPADVRSASSLTTFRRKLKAHLFRQSYPDIVL